MPSSNESDTPVYSHTYEDALPRRAPYDYRRLGTADETHYDAGGTPNFELSSRDERVPYGRGPSFVLSYALCTFEKRARGLPYPSSRRA